MLSSYCALPCSRYRTLGLYLSAVAAALPAEAETAKRFGVSLYQSRYRPLARRLGWDCDCDDASIAPVLDALVGPSGPEALSSADDDALLASFEEHLRLIRATLDSGMRPVLL